MSSRAACTSPPVADKAWRLRASSVIPISLSCCNCDCQGKKKIGNCWVGSLWSRLKKGLGSGGLWGTQQSFVRGVGGGVHPKGGPTLTLLYTIFDRKAGVDKILNSSLSFGQAALTFRLPSTTFCLSQLKISLAARGWVTWTLTHWAGELQKLLARQENPLVPDYWMRIFSSPGKGTPFVYLLLTNGIPFTFWLTDVKCIVFKIWIKTRLGNFHDFFTAINSFG